MYGKLFAQMYDGTLATKGPWQALVTFQQLIILADEQGVVDMTPEAISRRTTLPIEIILAGITALEQDDPDSRSPDLDGRRIMRLSDTRTWGWHIVNHAHYKAIRSNEDRREYMRLYQRARRANVNKLSTNVNKLAHTDTDTDTKAKIKSKSIARKRATPPPTGFGISKSVRTWADTKGYDNLEQHLESFLCKAEAKGYVYANWDKALQNAISEDWAGIRKSDLQGKTKPLTASERRRENLNLLCGRNADGTERANPASMDGTVIPASGDDLRGTEDGIVLRRLPAS